MNPIYTLGHSTRSWREFLEILQAHQIDCLCDVRHFPSSRRFPHFNRSQMETSLAEAGIDYVHEVDLGGRRAPIPDSPNTYWRVAQFRGFADHQHSPGYQAAIARLIERAKSERVAIMCAEAVPWRCHRQLIADDLALRGFDVYHIMSATKADRHSLNEAIRTEPSGQFHYAATNDA